jgi:hypothetical protein
MQTRLLSARAGTVALLCAMVLGSAAACDFSPAPPTPTFNAPTDTPAVTLTPSLTPSPTVSPTPRGAAALVMPTLPPQAPTVEIIPTATEGPFRHTIQQGETLLAIIQQYGYFTFDVLPEVVRLNGLPSADRLPGAGTVLLIPRPTPTGIPFNFAVTATACAGVGEGFAVGVTGICEQTGRPLGTHTVERGQTFIDIAAIYDMSLEQVSRLNQNYNWRGCDFNLPSGGPDCGPLLGEADAVNVYLPLPTLAPTATISGSETPTVTPTFPAPLVISPPDGSILPAGVFDLQWVSVGVLRADEVYFVELQDLNNGATFNDTTRDTALRLPDTLIPADGQPHNIQWRVFVARDQGGRFVPVGGIPPWRAFTWQSR